MRSRRRLLLASSLFVSLFAGPSAFAQKAPPVGGPSRSSAQFTLHREEAGGPEANTARQKARAGDCAGALPSFDAAIRVTIEPSLRRDRGLCHEKLEHPFPAIDDYRAYLVARPDAPDADQIRERLVRLEEQVGVGGRSPNRGSDQPPGSSDDSTASASFSASTEDGVKTSGKAASRKKSGKSTNYDYVVAQERLEEAADGSPLRFGEGFILGPYLQMPRYFSAFAGSSSLVNLSLYFSTGVTLRYAWSPEWTFISEIGYAGLLDRGVTVAGTNNSLGGVQTFVGFEGRIPLDIYSSNQLFLGIGPGYEYLSSSGGGGLHFMLGRGRFGYRHVFGSNIGLEISVDGGGGGVFGSSGGSRGTALVASNIGFLIGF